jgi:ribose transport system ATP-binding protein
MVGAPIDLEFPHRAPPVAEKQQVRLRATDIVGPNVGPASIEVRGGEIVGIAGAEGNGQRDLLRALVGQGNIGGQMEVDGKRVRFTGPHAALHAGVTFQSGDRAAESVFTTLSVLDNSTVQLAGETGPAGLAVRKRLLGRFGEAVRRLGIVAASPFQPIGALSGGNQQKIVLSRPTLKQPRVLIVDEPAQGVDAKARLEIYRMLSDAAESGVGVLVNSSDSSELAGLCDRVYIMSGGAITNELTEDITESKIVRSFVSSTEQAVNAGTEATRKARKVAAWTTSPSVPVVVLLALVFGLSIFMHAHDATFLSPANLTNLAITAMPVLCAAIGQQFALITGGFDISIGASMTMSVITTSFLLVTYDFGSLAKTIVVALLIGVVVGSFNAFLTLVLKINAVVATIGTLGILSGIAIFMRPEPGGSVAPDLLFAVMKGISGVPYIFVVVMAAAVALDFWLAKSRGGLAVRAVGLDREPSQRIGVPVNLIMWIGAVLAAIGATMGGLFLATQVGLGANNAGLGFALPTFAACFLGGATLAGGRGTFLGAALGVVLLTMISNATLLLGQTYAVSQMIYALILLVAVTVYALTARRASSAA